MSPLARPGITLAPARPARRVTGLARGDVPVLIGHATRGPVAGPVRVESLRAYEAVFGAPMPGTHLYDAVKGFFETGGRAAYVQRVVGPGARGAEASLGLWRARAQAALAGGADRAGDAPWHAALRRAAPDGLADPGPWANDLVVQVTRRARDRVPAVADAADRRLLQPVTLTGLSVHAVVGIGPHVARICALDAARGTVQLTRPLPDAVPPGADVMLAVVTFDIAISARGQQVEAYADLHLPPEHPAGITARLNAQSRLLWLDAPAGGDWTDPDVWPVDGSYPLGFGDADLAGLTRQSWEDALRRSAALDEIALVAAPDLVRQPDPPPTALEAGSARPPACDLPVPQPQGAIAGLVRDGATDLPVAGCAVMAAGEGRLAVTDAAGRFVLTGLPQGQTDLRLVARGFQPADHAAQALGGVGHWTPDAERTTISLIRQDVIAVLPQGDIIAVQRAMGEGGLAGPYRIAVLDAPAPDMAMEDLRGWRARLGDDRRLFALAPWIAVAQGDGTLAPQPPSGHVCGAFAQGELAQGIHRAPANLALRHAKTVTREMDDAALAACHAASLNALRALPGQGLRLMGARTLAPDAAWQQVTVRRLFDAIEKTLLARLQWAVFEPNAPGLRHILRFSVEQFLESLRRRGMFAGDSAAAAYAVTCDGRNNSPAEAARGEVILDIAIAPARPYEFIRISLQAQADAIEVTEQ